MSTNSASKRFAGLIPSDLDEPEVFETSSVDSGQVSSDGGDDDGALLGPEPEAFGDSDIDERVVTPLEAFEMFAGRRFDTRRADFSDEIYRETKASRNLRRGGGRQGLQGERQEIGTGVEVGTVGVEERLKKFERLKREIGELVEEEETKGVGREVLEEMRTLKELLRDVEDAGRGDGRSVWRNLRGVGAVENKEKDGKDKRTAESEVTLELYPTEDGKLIELERRIAALEKVLGPTRVTEGALSEGLCSLAASIKSKLSLMDEEKREMHRKGVEDLERSVDRIVKKKGDEFEHAEKIVRTFEMMEKWDGLIGMLPTIVSRLRSMKRLHEEAAGFSKTLRALDEAQAALTVETKRNEELTRQLRDTFNTNSETMRRNIDALNQRLARS